MPYKTPASFTATRRLKLRGVTYAKDEQIPMDVFASLKKGDVLVAMGWIRPDADPHSRKGKFRPRPYSTPPAAYSKFDVTATAGVTGLAASDEDSESVVLSWTNPADVDLAKIFVRQAAGDTAPATYRSGSAVTLASDTAETVTVTGLAEETLYSWAVFAKDAAGNISDAATVTATTAAAGG